MDVARRGRRED